MSEFEKWEAERVGGEVDWYGHKERRAAWNARDSEVAELKRQLAEAMKALHDLTPGGSEFVGDIQRCVKFVTDRRDALMEGLAEAKRQLAEAKDLMPCGHAGANKTSSATGDGNYRFCLVCAWLSEARDAALVEMIKVAVEEYRSIIHRLRQGREKG